MVTDPQTNKQTHKQTNPRTGPITIHCAAASMQCKKKKERKKLVACNILNIIYNPGQQVWNNLSASHKRFRIFQETIKSTFVQLGIDGVALSDFYLQKAVTNSFTYLFTYLKCFESSCCTIYFVTCIVKFAAIHRGAVTLLWMRQA